MKKILYVLLFTLFTATAWSQAITGPSPVYVNTAQQYIFNNAMVYTNYIWLVTGGTVTSSSQNGLNYYVNVTWNTVGTGSVKFKQLDNGVTIVGTLSVTVQTCPTPSTPTATFSNTNNCTSTVITETGTPPANTLWYWQTTATGTATTNSTSSYTITTSATYYLRPYSTCGVWGTAEATANYTINSTLPSAPTAVNTALCGTGTMTATPGTPATSIKWYSASTGGSLLATATSSPSTSTTTTYYITSYITSTGCESAAPRLAVTLTINPIPAAPTATAAYVCGSGTMTATPGTNGNAIRWYSAATGGTPLAATGITSPTAITTTTYYITSYNTITSCESTAARVATTLTVNPIPQVTVTTGSPVQLSTGSNNSYQWKKFGTDISGATSQNYTPDGPGSFSVGVTATSGATQCVSVPVTSNLGTQPAPVNYVSAIAITKEGVVASSLPTLNPQDLAQAISYQDGIGRTFQNVGVGLSGNLTDMVSATGFGKQGVTDTTYLPFAAGSKSGLLRLNALRTSSNIYIGSDQYQFYQSATNVAHDGQPIARSIHRTSPDARVIEQGAPGADWQPGTTPQTGPHTVQSTITLNTTSYPVRYWKYDGSTNGNYPAGTVTVAITTDENRNAVRTYTNKQGQTILKQVQVDQTANWLETYYIYDQFGRLVYQLSPNAMVAITTTTYNVASNSATDELVYKYNYDSLGRVVEKKTPGSGWQYIIYDKLGRVALTQDANQRTGKQWLFVKYDMLNRPVYSGIYTETTLSSRKAMQNYYIAIDYTTVPYYEANAVNATYQGYSNTVFPTANLTVLAASYYDDYDFDRNGTPDYTYDNTHLTGIATSSNAFTRGLATGSKKLILGSTNWLITAIFYDQYDRPIQTQSNNHLNLAVQDKTSVLYKDLVHVDRTKSTHTGTTTVSVTQRYTYDNAWRTTGIFHTINSNSEQQVAAYQYNALGQVIQKNLHNTGGSNFMQNVDMRYTIRGWLSSINNAQLANDGGVTNSDTNDYFGMEMFYNNSEQSSLGNTPTYNGNISAVKWKNGGVAAGAADQRSYKYSYDKSEKLLGATFQANTGSAWTKESNTLNESTAYDHNGNILSLIRKQNQRGLLSTTVTSKAQTIDSLFYTFATGNQLSNVSDASSNTAGFKDVANASTVTEYTYAGNGSLTADVNKGISGITYNVLNKPATVTFSDGRSMAYTYDAMGTKLKTATTVSGVTTTTDYVNSYVYTNNALSFFSAPEGRVLKNGSNYEYQYAITDNEGNTRVLFTSAPQTAQSVTAGFETANQTTEASNFSGYPNTSHINVVATNAHTGSNSEYLNGGLSGQVGVAKSYKVFPGDQLQIQAYAKYNSPSGTQSNLIGFASALLGAFNLAAPAQGEVGTPSAGINTWGAVAAGGYGDGTTDNTDPKVFVTIVIFDKNYNFMDVAFSQLTSSGSMNASYKVKEAGYAFMYISNEQQYQTDVYFDDVTMTYTPSSILQSSEYYPFGLQTATSWTRDNTTNNFLYDGGDELNPTSGLYDLEYRNYDPALARMHQVDPMTDKYSSLNPYNYSFNNPVMYNDPNGAFPIGVPRYTYHNGPGAVGDGPNGIDHGAPVYHDGYGGMTSGSNDPDYIQFTTGDGNITQGSGGYWGDGIRYNDWTLSDGSQTYRDAQAAGAIDIGGQQYLIGGDGSRTQLQQNRNGQYGFWVNSASYQNNGISFDNSLGGVGGKLGAFTMVSKFVAVSSASEPGLLDKVSNFFSDGVFTFGGGATAALGMVGGTVSAGVVIDFKNGFKTKFFVTYGTAFGADLSGGLMVTYNKPTSGTLQIKDVSGMSEGYTLGIGPVDGTKGGDSFFQSFDPGRGRDYHSTYNTYGLGYSAGLPLGFTRSTTNTVLFGGN